MDSGVLLTILVISVVVFSVFVYVAVMVMFPEWVGITGKKAKEAQRSHAGDAHVADEKSPSNLSEKSEEKP